jgi:peptidoglycan/LPS O-acetylase OafA/YrhL
MVEEMAGKGRMHALDGLRGLAALGVVLLHVWIYTGANAPDKSLTTDLWMGELRLCVLLFFVLSGFLLASPWIAAARGEREAPKLGRFIARRAARIVPAYWLALAGAVLLLHGTGHGRDVPLHDLPKFALFVPNVFPDTRNQLDPPMWSLHVEVSFYIVLPLIGLALMRAGRGRRGPLAVCAVLIAAGVAWTTAGVLGDWAPEVTWTLPTYLATFSCGITAAVLAHGAQPRRWVAHTAFLGGAAVVLADAYWHQQGYSAFFHALRDLPAAIGFAAMVWSVALRSTPVLGSAPLRALGTLSYGVYLWHYLVIYWLQLHDRFPQHFPTALLYVVPLTFVLATASWFLVEKPILRLSARALRRGREPSRQQPAMAES